MKRAKGFTIVELLIVIVVIGILAAITIVAYNGIQDRARTTARVSDVRSIQQAIELYHADNGTYPTTGSVWLFQRQSGDAFIPGLVPTYIARLPSVSDGPTGSATNNTYIYRSDGTNYKLDRLYQPSLLAGEAANIPTSMKDSTWTDRWGVWSPGGSGF